MNMLRDPRGGNLLRLGLACGAAVLVAACGGGDTKPANSPASSASPTNASGPSPVAGPPMKGADRAASSSSADVTKGIEALKAGDLNGAKALFEVAIQSNPKQADAHFYLGVVLEQQGNKAAAEKEYKEALAAQPDLVEASANLTALYVESKKNDEAIGVAKKALEKNPRHAELQLNYAAALAAKGDKDGSQKAFEEAIKLKPTDARFFLMYAHELAEWKKNDDALAKLKQAAKLGDADAAVLAEVGFELKALKEFKECIAVMDKAVALKDVAELRIYRGQCRLGLKEKDAALADFQSAVQKEPSSAPAHYHLGGALADTGKLKEAIAEWEQAVKLQPTGPLAKGAEQKIAKAKEILAKKK